MRKGAFILAFVAACTVAEPVAAQGNDDDYTPLNSRIRRDRQFPTSLVNPWGDRTTAVNRERSRVMMSQFKGCVFRRSREGSLELLQKTDYGFRDFAQIGLDNDRALRIYGFHDCLGRVASNQGLGVRLSFNAGALRQWMLEEAYFDRFKDGPTWLHAGYVVGDRSYPLSAQNPGVSGPLDFADCLVTKDPYTADFFYRTQAGSPEEQSALQALTPSLSPCLPQGIRVELNPYLVRVWVGEALWHAANNSAAAPAGATAEGG